MKINFLSFFSSLFVFFSLPLASSLDQPLRSINCYGLETELAFQCGLSCCWVKPNEFYLQKVKDLGFNSIRLPFSAEYINAGNLTLMDNIIDKAGELGLEIVLDYHRTYAGHQGDWFDTNFQDFVGVWHRVLFQYYDKPHVRWVDLFNEFQQPNTPQNVAFWNDLMKRSILYLEAFFPNRFSYFVGGTNWGGNLHGIKVEVDDPMLQSRIYYTLHKYQWSVSGSDYLHDYEVSFGGWGSDRLFIGEFGWIQDDPQQREWGAMFLDYLKERGITKTSLWCLSYFSGDTQGILKSDCLNVEQEKLTMLQNFWNGNRQLLALHQEQTEQQIAEDDQDDWDADEDLDDDDVVLDVGGGNKQQLKVGWHSSEHENDPPLKRRPRKCSYFHNDHERCERHSVCCYRKADDICFKCS